MRVIPLPRRYRRSVTRSFQIQASNDAGLWSAQQEAIHRVSVGPDIIQQKTEVAMPDKTIDVIIPVYRPGKELRELLIRLTKQTVKPSKILLMNTEKE